MGSSIRAAVRRMIESPAGGLVATALVWAVVWPWLSRRHRQTRRPPADRTGSAAP